MSERQAKLRRKNEVKETPKKKKSAVDVIFNIIIVILVLAVLGIGGYAVYNKYKQAPQQDSTATDTTQMTDEQQVAPTIAEYAQTEKGMDAETFMAEFGLVGIEGVTAESLMTDAMNYLTLANFAKLSDMDVATVKEQYGLSDEYSEDTLMGDIFAEQMAAAETEAETATEETAE